MKRKLVFLDFHYIHIPNTLSGYFSYRHGKYEICIEPCFDGHKVAIYDDQKSLICPKKVAADSLGSAVEAANVLLVQYILK
jgi:hypothetical protein